MDRELSDGEIVDSDSEQEIKEHSEMSNRIDSIYRSYDKPDRRRSRSRSLERRRGDRRGSSRDRHDSYRSNGYRRSRSRSRDRRKRSRTRSSSRRSRSPSRKMSRSREESRSSTTSTAQIKDGFVFTPFGAYKVYPAPNPKEFVFEPGSGYFFDNKTGFYMDPNSGYYFDPGTKEWNFWSPLYNTYIPCEGGNIEWKKSLQILEKEEEFLRMSRSKSPTTMVKIFEQFKDYTSGDENGDHSYSSFTRHQEDKRKAFEKSLAKDPIRLEPISHVLEKAPQKPAEPWMCIKCDTENGYTRKNCFKCGSKKETAEEFEARGAHLIGIEPNDTLIIRDFPKDIEEAVFRKWIIDFAGSITKRFHVADSKKYYLIQSISIEKATQFLTEFNKVSTQTNITVKVNFSKTPLHELVPEKLATPSAQIPAPVVSAPTFASVGTFASTSTFASTVVSAPSFAPVGTFASAPTFASTVVPAPTFASTKLPPVIPQPSVVAAPTFTSTNLPPVIPKPSVVSPETRRLPSHAAGSWMSSVPAPNLAVNSAPVSTSRDQIVQGARSTTATVGAAATFAVPPFVPIVSTPTPVIVSSTNTQKLVDSTCEMIVVIHNQKEFVLQNYTDPYIQALLNYYATKIEILLKDFTDMASREKKMGKFAAHPDLIDKAAVILRHCLEQNESLMKLLFERMALDHKVAFQDFAIRIQTTLNTLLEDGTVKKPVEPAKKIEVEKRSSDSKPRRQSPSSSKTKEEIREEYASSDSDDDGRRAGDPTSKTPLTGEDAFSLQLKKFVEDKKNSKKGVELCFNCARLGHKPSECIYAKAPKTLLEQMRFLYKVWKDEGKPTYTDIVERYKKRRVVVQRKFDKNKVELNGRDRLTRQLRELVPDGRVRRTHLVLCKNCAHIGHLQNECRKPPAENYHVQEMRVLIDIFVKKYRLDDVIVANIRYEDLSRESSARSRDEPRRISRSTHENSPLPSASSLTSASILPPPLEPSRPQPNLVNKPTPRPQVPRNSSANFAPNLFHILNAPEKVFGISQSEPESHLPELTGKDRLSQQLKILAPNGRVSSRLLRLCEKCACVGHKKEDCTYPQAKLEEIQMMKHLINIYQEIYGQMILANDMYEASSEKANVSREGPAQLMPKNGPIELDGKDPFSVEVQKVMLREGRITNTLLKLCNNCGQLGHAIKDCRNMKADSDLLYKMSTLRNLYLQKNGFSEELSEEEEKKLTITGTDPFSKQLKAICPDGLVLKKHLVLCMNCAQLGHVEQLCKNSWVGNKQVQEMLALQKQYKEKWHEENLKNMNTYKITGSDPFSLQLKEIAPYGNVTVQNLLVCRSCAMLGHKPVDCRQPKPWTPDHLAELKKMFAYRRKYMKGVLAGNFPPIKKDSISQENASIEFVNEELDEFGSDDER